LTVAGAAASAVPGGIEIAFRAGKIRVSEIPSFGARDSSCSNFDQPCETNLARSGIGLHDSAMLRAPPSHMKGNSRRCSFRTTIFELDGRFEGSIGASRCAKWENPADRLLTQRSGSEMELIENNVT
jgi:hypothetical protein